MITDLFDYFGSFEEEPIEVIKINAPKVEVVTTKVVPVKDDDFYDGACGCSNASGKRKVKSKRPIRNKKQPIVKKKQVVQRKRNKPVSTSNTRIVTFGSNNNFDKKVMQSMDRDKFFNLTGENITSVEFGV